MKVTTSTTKHQANPFFFERPSNVPIQLSKDKRSVMGKLT